MTRSGTSSGSASRTAWRAPAALIAVCAALLAVGIVLLVRAHTRDTSGPVANKAVVDAAATGELTGQVSTALDGVLSYNYQQPQVSAAAAGKWLTGDAPAQYRMLLGELKTLAKGQDLTEVAQVNKIAVSSLQGDTAQLLVFIDQSSTRASDHASSVVAAQVQIAAVRQGGMWKISELKPL